MTLEERFASGIVVKELDNDYICELWGASTKHPDASFRYWEWDDRTDLFEDK